MVETPFSVTYEEDVKTDEYEEDVPSNLSVAPGVADYDRDTIRPRSYTPPQRSRPQEDDEDSRNWILPPASGDDEGAASRETGWGWLADETRRRLDGQDQEDEDAEQEEARDYMDPFSDDEYGQGDDEATVRPSGEREDGEDEEDTRWEALSVNSWASEDEPVVGDQTDDDIRNMDGVVGSGQQRADEEEAEQYAAEVWREEGTSPGGDAYLSRTRQALADIEQSLPDSAAGLDSMSVAPLEDLTSQYGLSALTESYGGSPDVQQSVSSPAWAGDVGNSSYDGGGFRNRSFDSGSIGSFRPGRENTGLGRSSGGSAGIGTVGPGQPTLPLEPTRPLDETSGRSIGIDAFTR
jgi:hypothetical protein